MTYKKKEWNTPCKFCGKNTGKKSHPKGNYCEDCGIKRSQERNKKYWENKLK